MSFFSNLLIIFFALAHAERTVVDRMEASVNDSVILRSDVERFRKILPLRAELDPMFATSGLAKKGANAPSIDIVNQLINDRIILSRFPVADGEVEQEIQTIKGTNKVTDAQLEGALSSRGYVRKDYFEGIRLGLATRKLNDQEIRTRATVSEDDIRQFYFNTHRDGASHFSYKISLLKVSPENYKTPADAKGIAVKALSDIKSGQSFADVAKRVSDDASAEGGGDLGYLTEASMSSEFRAAVRKMRSGEVSNVLGDAKSAFFLLKLEDVKSSGDEAFLKEKETIRAELTTQEFMSQYRLWLERQRSQAHISLAGQRSIKPGVTAAPKPAAKP